MGHKGGIPKDIPDEYHWWDINWDIFDSKSILILKCPLAKLMDSTTTVTLLLIRQYEYLPSAPL